MSCWSNKVPFHTLQTARPTSQLRRRNIPSSIADTLWRRQTVAKCGIRGIRAIPAKPPHFWSDHRVKCRRDVEGSGDALGLSRCSTKGAGSLFAARFIIQPSRTATPIVRAPPTPAMAAADGCALSANCPSSGAGHPNYDRGGVPACMGSSSA